MKKIIIEISGGIPLSIKTDIDSLVGPLPHAPIWQTIEWQLMLHETGYVSKSFFLGVYDGQKLKSYTMLEKRSVGFGQFSLFAIGGPVFDDTSALEMLSEAMQEIAKQEKAISVQCEPLEPCALPGFQKGHYKDFIEKHTAIIDLTQSEEEILSRMKQKGRYNIRLAEKSGVTVELVPFSHENLDIFYRLLSETTQRDGFAANSKWYFEVFLRYLEENKLGGLSFAKRENEIIAGGIFVFFGKTALYYYGASSSDNAKRKYMATYLLQWKMILEAKKRGCKTFDFLGIANPTDSTSHLTGVTDFKLKLTNETKKWPESQILVVRTGWWWFLKIVRGLKLKGS